MPWIDQTNTKVVEIALDKLAHGWSPEEIAYQHYGQLSLAQIHAALSYYYDHEHEMHAVIEKQIEDFEKRRTASLDSPGRLKLKALGTKNP
ncbi:MAG: DUF433 domain-containing protein [Gemmataceae bacterium]|nr:DUF433 domain-containing protein [Gemmataceae bacterium]